MRTFQVTVNGKAYDVQVQETTGSAAVTAAPAVAPAPAVAAKAAPAAGTKVKAPMPGVIVGVKVSVGDAVKKGQVLLILEAMKMENEIQAAQDGTVAQVAVAKGTSVKTGDLMVVIS